MRHTRAGRSRWAPQGMRTPRADTSAASEPSSGYPPRQFSCCLPARPCPLHGVLPRVLPAPCPSQLLGPGRGHVISRAPQLHQAGVRAAPASAQRVPSCHQNAAVPAELTCQGWTSHRLLCAGTHAPCQHACKRTSLGSQALAPCLRQRPHQGPRRGAHPLGGRAMAPPALDQGWSGPPSPVSPGPS